MDAQADNDVKQLYDAVLLGDAVRAKKIAEEALSAGIEPLRLVNDFMSPAMGEAGKRFEAGDYFVPQLLLSARAMKTALAPIRPLLAARGTQAIGRVIIGTVKGDLHDIGKNIVAAVLEGGGFEVIDLGVGVTPEKFVSAVREKAPDILGLSALLTTTMFCMKETIQALHLAGLRDRVKVLVGGAPVTRTFAEEIGADDFGNSATEALRVAKQIIGISHAR
jgi:corrinoid protein of di/trimethylamine methyltransferase